jgi:hypothetical protein
MKYILPIIFILVFSFTIFGATFTVTRTDDRDAGFGAEGDRSLREAVAAAFAAGGNNLINFQSDIKKITLTDEIHFRGSRAVLTVQGTGADVLTIDGGAGANRIFEIQSFNTVISGVTLTGGNDSRFGGGAIFVLGGSLTLSGVNITGNSTNGVGGGIYYQYDEQISGLQNIIINSTISGNSATNGGGVNNYFGAKLTIINSTISGNTATNEGGGFLSQSLGEVSLKNVTITNNTAGVGGGVALDNANGFQGTINLFNSIVAGNTASVGSELYNAFANRGAIISSGNNLIGDAPGKSAKTGNGTVIFHSSDIRDVNPLLGTLQNNGGQTDTHSLLPGSPAINAGNNANALQTDQRGAARIVNGVIDIGAFEAVPLKSRKRVRFF